MRTHVTAKVLEAGYSLNDELRWLKPIWFKKNKNSDGLQWHRQLERLNADCNVQYSLAVQYLARVAPLQRHGGTLQTVYRKPTCSESGCHKYTRNFHCMMMRYICSGCVNNKMLTYSLISRAVAMRFFAVGTHMHCNIIIYNSHAHPHIGHQKGTAIYPLLTFSRLTLAIRSCTTMVPAPACSTPF